MSGFSALFDLNKQTTRGPVNPLDKSTVISIFPKHIREVKHTIQPGVFEINPGTYENPSALVVGPSSWWKELDNNQPLLEIPISSIQIANSVVNDYCNGILGCNMADIMPGIFYLPGEWTVERVKKEHKSLLDDYAAKQRGWYQTLIKLADTLWARTNGNPLTISDDMRLAARELNLSGGKEWTKDSQTMELVRCKACGALKNPLFPICSTCKAIDDPARAKELGLVFAQ